MMGSVHEVPKLQAFPDGTPMEKVFEALYRDGAVVIKNLISEEDIRGIQADIKPHMDAEYNSGLDVFAKQTKTVCGLAGKSPSAVKAILQHPTVKAAIKDVLEVTTLSYWGDMENLCTSPPLLSSMFTVRVGPGSARQGLHRDDQDHHATHRNADPKETTKLGCFVALTKVTKENGATEVVPKSNIWDDIRKPKEEEVTYGEMDAGDAIFCLGNTFHGAGGNTTVDDFRSVVVTLFCKGVYRAEENQFLAVDRETVKKMDHDVQDLLGWKASAPFCGWHELGDPSRLIRENDGVKKDLF